MLHDREVVRDEEVGEPELASQLGQQVQDLRLHGDVEGGGGLVADHDPRPQHERARDRDALTLAARELCRIALAQLGGEADTFQHRPDARRDLARGTPP